MSFPPDKELMAELMAVFASEAADQLQSLNRNLLALEETTDAGERQQLLAEIFRDAHTLKGGAAVVDLKHVATLAHHLESIFAVLQREELRADPDLFDLLYQTLDVVEGLVREAQGGEPAAAGVSGLAERLESAAKEERVPTQAPEAVPRPPDGTRRQALAGPEERDVAEQPAVRAAGEETIRVATSKLDSLMTQVGELVVAGTGSQRNVAEVRGIGEELAELTAAWREARSHYRRSATPTEEAAAPDGGAATSPRLRSRHASGAADFLEEAEPQLLRALERVNRLARAVRADGRRMKQITADLQDDVRRARMLPVSTVFDTFPRMVRDLAREQGKKVRLDIRGGDTQMDRIVLEQIKAPLTHLLRNCVDHGIEEPRPRSVAGKSSEGVIFLSASQHGDSVSIEVADDGAGIDLETVKATAIDKGLVASDDAGAISDRDALALIFNSGLSTSPLITEVSGRGVGLDVVRENVERLNGTIELDTVPGQGTKLSLDIPLTVTTTRCVLIRVSGQIFALPISNIERMVRVAPEDVHEAEGREVIAVAGKAIALRSLAAILGLEEPERNELRPALIIRSAEKTVALLVDQTARVEEVVVKSLPRPLLRVRHAAGATVLGTGEVSVVLNVADVVRSALGSEAPASRARLAETAKDGRPAVILLADDSITTRTLEKNILQAAGYEVRVAVDGVDAWTSLQADGADLVVSDIQMPRMDGFDLTAKIRSDERFKHLPVVLVTSLESAADRERGIEVGADAYIGKSGFDQEQLLDVIRRLI
jgi:two-component system chemotaxis sensor kinase CheA